MVAVIGLWIGTTASAQSSKTIVPKPKIQTSAKPEQTAVLKSSPNDSSQKSEKTVKATSKTVKSNSGKAVGKAPKKSVKKVDRKSSPRKTESVGNDYRALKSNIAYDAFAALNLAFEMQVHRRVSVELPVIWSFWDMEREHGIRVVALQPEGRWWISEAGKGHFFGVHAHVAWFNMKWKDTRYQSDERPLLGAGISYGYKLPLNEHWGAEFSLGAGYANMKYDTYYNIENGAKLDTRIRNYWGITRIGLSLVYRF